MRKGPALDKERPFLYHCEIFFMNGLVLYRSRNGATRQYADWIGTALRLPVIDPERVDDG